MELYRLLAEIVDNLETMTLDGGPARGPRRSDPACTDMRMTAARDGAKMVGPQEDRAMNTQRRIAEPSRRKATYQDVLDAPPNMVAEIIDGILHTHPRPAARHAWASSILGMEVGSPFGRSRSGPGGWWIIFEPELHLGEDIVVPDLAGWRRETMPEYPDSAYFEIAPDWVCEVLSPSTRCIDLGGKREFYARESVGHLWFVDPEARTLETFELRKGQWLLTATLADDAPVSLPPFDAITFPLDALWPETAQKIGSEIGEDDETDDTAGPGSE